MIGRAYSDNDDNPNDEDFGEGFEFDIYKTTRTLFEAFGLMEDAKQQSVELGLASDGAQLTHTLSHVAAGLKYMGMRNPFTKQPLLLHEPDSLVQSRSLCFPLRVVIAKDNKKTLDGFRFLYNEFSSGNVSTALQCCPLKMSYPGNMKLQWGALDQGGVLVLVNAHLEEPLGRSKKFDIKSVFDRFLECFFNRVIASSVEHIIDKEE